MLDEESLIAGLKRAFPSHIGDDAAVIDKNAADNYVVSKDLLIEDVHFRPCYTDARSLAHKALQVNLSDIAAMGAAPQLVLLGIAIPSTQEDYAREFLRYFAEACKTAAVTLIGGDTTASHQSLCISVTAIGSAQKKHLKYRNHAKAGDRICVVGNLGAAHVGLTALENDQVGFEKYKNVFLRPSARIKVGQWLGFRIAVRAMMDLSDGLLIDLQRLCEASNAAGSIHLEKLRPDVDFIKVCKLLHLDPIKTMLVGGEDYGLLFTVDPAEYLALKTAFELTFVDEIQCIGEITSGSGVNLLLEGVSQKLNLKPFTHFGESISNTNV